MQKITRYLIWIGIIILAAGFIYSSAFVGIPPQDPPEYLIIEYNRSARIAEWILQIGLVVTVAGAILRVIRRLSRG